MTGATKASEDEPSLQIAVSTDALLPPPPQASRLPRFRLHGSPDAARPRARFSFSYPYCEKDRSREEGSCGGLFCKTQVEQAGGYLEKFHA